ncbi:acyltransferase family protein [Dermabacteraceae bacterium P13138]
MSVTSPAPAASKRLLWVDTLRGIAICLVVFHHSFIVVPRFSEFLNSVDEAVITLRMPLLFFVSGCMVPGSMRRGMKHYLDSRVRHVIWPYLGWQAQYIVMVGSVMGLFNLVYWGPMSTLWFLFFLIVYYLIAPLSRYVTWFGLSAAGLVLWLLIPYKTLPDLLGAYTLTPREMAFYAFFFYLGAATFGWIRAFRATRAQVLGAGLVLAVCLAIAAQGVVKFTWEFLLLGVAGGAAMLVLFTAMPDNPAMRALAWVGKRAVVVYVIHVPVFMYLSFAVERFGIARTPLLWFASLVFTYLVCFGMGALRYKTPFSILFEMPKSWAPWNWKRDEAKRDLVAA